MKKEVLIAIITGFILGLLITFGVWTVNKTIKKDSAEPTPTPEEQVQITPTLPQKKELSLVIVTPEDNTISNEEEIEISGKTAKEAIVVILYQDGEKILEANSEGAFETMITLIGGNNDIKISAYDAEGNEITKTISVVYSTAEI